jgi:hypothetical protein
MTIYFKLVMEQYPSVGAGSLCRPPDGLLSSCQLADSEGTPDPMTSPAIADWLKQVGDEARADSPSSDLEEFVAANAEAIERDNMRASIATTRRISARLVRLSHEHFREQ